MTVPRWENAKLSIDAYDLTGQRALVVGAASGAGRAIALAFAEAGADLALCTETTMAEDALELRKTARDAREMGRNVVEHERLTGQMPSGSGWLAWLEYRYPSDDITEDPWGSVYQLEVSRDSVWVISLGPDRTRQTGDDFRVVTPRGS